MLRVADLPSEPKVRVLWDPPWLKEFGVAADASHERVERVIPRYPRASAQVLDLAPWATNAEVSADVDAHKGIGGSAVEQGAA